VPVNCGAIPSELMESEFFGHEKGSFTGAVAAKQGLFQAAEGGTLFLDEVADLPLSMQVKLLRAIQEKAVRAVGSATEHGIDVRILSATHKDLSAEVSAGRFRQDLYYRLNVIELAMPALRERAADVPELADQILDRLAQDYGEAKPSISPEAMQHLMAYDFPGNVRELENILERAFTLCEENCIQVADLQLSGPANLTVDSPTEEPRPAAASTASAGEKVELAPGQSLEDFLDTIERQLITDALDATRWNKTSAAKRLGITFRALRYRLKKLELE
jgi:two-component system response regulator PilR (NtrC family)